MRHLEFLTKLPVYRKLHQRNLHHYFLRVYHQIPFRTCLHSIDNVNVYIPDAFQYILFQIKLIYRIQLRVHFYYFLLYECIYLEQNFDLQRRCGLIFRICNNWVLGNCMIFRRSTIHLYVIFPYCKFLFQHKNCNQNPINLPIQVYLHNLYFILMSKLL